MFVYEFRLWKSTQYYSAMEWTGFLFLGGSVDSVEGCMCKKVQRSLKSISVHLILSQTSHRSKRKKKDFSRFPETAKRQNELPKQFFLNVSFLSKGYDSIHKRCFSVGISLINLKIFIPANFEPQKRQKFAENENLAQFFWLKIGSNENVVM